MLISIINWYQFGWFCNNLNRITNWWIRDTPKNKKDSFTDRGCFFSGWRYWNPGRSPRKRLGWQHWSEASTVGALVNKRLWRLTRTAVGMKSRLMHSLWSLTTGECLGQCAGSLKSVLCFGVESPETNTIDYEFSELIWLLSRLCVAFCWTRTSTSKQYFFMSAKFANFPLVRDYAKHKQP